MSSYGAHTHSQSHCNLIHLELKYHNKFLFWNDRAISASVNECLFLLPLRLKYSQFIINFLRHVHINRLLALCYCFCRLQISCSLDHTQAHILSLHYNNCSSIFCCCCWLKSEKPLLVAIMTNNWQKKRMKSHPVINHNCFDWLKNVKMIITTTWTTKKIIEAKKNCNGSRSHI